MTTAAKKQVGGGSFLVEDHELDLVFTPEDLTEQDHQFAQSVDEFVRGEVVPRTKELEQGNNDEMVILMKKAGELGYLAAEIPAEHGGMELGKTTMSCISEKSNIVAGFTVGMGAHSGIGTMPITYFGNDAQKAKYLPKLATGELLAAYALTETTSGSDALSARTTAVLSADGSHYLLNGNKMWITNAGFADIFIVFAKIDGKNFTGFIVERGFEGVSVGAEEKKMGIKSSSTRMLNLDNVKVPVENLLGVPGEGHKIAFNILNIGRFKLGGSCIGASKYALEMAAKYALERQAFGKPIASFGLMQHKLGEMAIRIFSQESMTYRAGGMMDQALEGLSFKDEGAADLILKGIREYAIECAMVKVYCTEGLDYIVDENLQIHGGYGYSAEYEAERLYRDSRINRIFEGTNEINRMLIVDMLIKKAMSGELPLLKKVQGLMEELMGMPSFSFDQDETYLAEEKKMVDNAKKITMFVSGVGFQKFMAAIQDQQELLGMAADLLIETYVMESMLLRTQKQAQRGGAASAATMEKMVKVYFHDAMERIAAIAKTGLACIEDGDTLLTMLAALRRLSKHPAVNTVALRREIAEKVLENKGFAL